MKKVLFISFLVAMFVIVGDAVPAVSPSCSISPSAVTTADSWTVSAVGLPQNTVNLNITFPNGGRATGPITVTDDGSYTETDSIYAVEGNLYVGLTGTYLYQFVGKVKWPEGTFTKLYAECSVTVT